MTPDSRHQEVRNEAYDMYAAVTSDEGNDEGGVRK